MLVFLLTATSLAAAPPRVVVDTTEAEEVAVEAPRPIDPPCRAALDPLGVRTVAGRDAHDLLDVVPGMWLGAHLGHGGARDWSWRGFGGTHGADIEVTVDGVPLNAPGHVAGHGYVDLAFLPRRMVDGVDVCRGTSRPGAGWFATAGSVGLRTGLAQPGWRAGFGTGTDGSGRIDVAWRPRKMDAGTFVLFDTDDGQGVGVDRSWRHLRLLGGVEGDLEQVHGAVWIALHDGAFDVPPTLREDDLDDGTIGFRSAYRLWAGRTESRRALLGARLSRPWDWGALQVGAWFGVSGYRRFDNRTGFLDHPDQGDGEEIGQTSTDAGVRGSVLGRWQILGDETRVEGGIGLRTVSHDQGGYTVDLLQARLAPTFARQVGTLGLFTWGRAHVGLFRRAHLVAGIRAEHLRLSRLDLSDPDALGEGGMAPVLQGEVAAVVRASERTSLHVSWSHGSRPADPRWTDFDAPIPVARFDTVDASATFVPAPWMSASVSAFLTLGQDEVLRDLRDTTTLYEGATRRLGGELTLSFRPVEGVRIDADAAISDSRHLDSGDPLPYAPGLRTSLALITERRTIGPVALTGSLRFTYLGARPLPFGFVARDLATLDLTADLDWRAWTFHLGVENLAPYDWRGAEFVHPSRWDRSTRPSQLPVRHVVAGRPFALTIGVTRWF